MIIDKTHCFLLYSHENRPLSWWCLRPWTSAPRSVPAGRAWALVSTATINMLHLNPQWNQPWTRLTKFMASQHLLTINLLMFVNHIYWPYLLANHGSLTFHHILWQGTPVFRSQSAWDLARHHRSHSNSCRLVPGKPWIAKFHARLHAM